MKGLVVLGVCAMNMLGFGERVANPGGTSTRIGEEQGQDLASTPCHTFVSNDTGVVRSSTDKDSDASSVTRK